MRWYASPLSSHLTDVENAYSVLPQANPINDTETEAILRQMGQYIQRELIKGNTVRVPGLGTFRLSFHSKGVDDICTFDADKMITKTHVVFQQEKALKNILDNHISFINDGVKDRDVIYASVSEYLAEQHGTSFPDSGEVLRNNKELIRK